MTLRRMDHVGLRRSGGEVGLTRRSRCVEPIGATIQAEVDRFEAELRDQLLHFAKQGSKVAASLEPGRA
jgi:hypothetical protein